MKKNIFCKLSHLTNEASVEKWFMDRLLEYLSFTEEDIKPKTALREFKVGQGSKATFYKPDYVIVSNGFPALVVDAKSPDEDIDDWTHQCSSYCLELNKTYEHNPVEYFLISNGMETALYKWDQSKPLVLLKFEDFHEANPSFLELQKHISKPNLAKRASEKHQELMGASFEFRPISLDEINELFARLHRYIWRTEKKSPSAAFEELIKIIFIKIKKDRELYERLGNSPHPKVKDVVFSVSWIKNQVESENPINDPLFKNLIKDLEKEIHSKKKKRMFDKDEDIDLRASTIERVVRELEHIDLHKMDEDVNGRMFESFLDATIRGKELGQYFTPRDIVWLMVHLADIRVTKSKTETVLDACCGSGGFLIAAMIDMLRKAESLAGLSNEELKDIKSTIINRSIYGIDAGSDPPIYRIARMNMYLHGDGGGHIYFADSLDKNVGQVGKMNMEIEEEIAELRDLLLAQKTKFDVILSNPPFSMDYARDDPEQRQIMDQYDVAIINGKAQSLLSSIMFLERYRDLVSEDGRILAIIDESILSGQKYRRIRDFIRDTFIIKGVISLPGDAFQRAKSRVKTSVIILRLKKKGEIQPGVFMERSVYLGLTEKTAKRLGISKQELEEGKQRELESIVEKYRAFEKGIGGSYVVPGTRITDRLDVKYCISDLGRRKPLWKEKGFEVAPLSAVLQEAKGRAVPVEEDETYSLLRVTYEGEVVEADVKRGDELSYSHLKRVQPWDILISNMGVGRGAIGVVPTYLGGAYVSNEFTILLAKSREEALFYTDLLRSKEILGDILSNATGLNRGRIKWKDMSDIEVPVYDQRFSKLSTAVQGLEDLWENYQEHVRKRQEVAKEFTSSLALESEDSRLRWLANKPPE